MPVTPRIRRVRLARAPILLILVMTSMTLTTIAGCARSATERIDDPQIRELARLAPAVQLLPTDQRVRRRLSDGSLVLEPAGAGSGFQLPNGLLVTAAHVLVDDGDAQSPDLAMRTPTVQGRPMLLAAGPNVIVGSTELAPEESWMLPWFRATDSESSGDDDRERRSNQARYANDWAILPLRHLIEAPVELPVRWEKPAPGTRVELLGWLGGVALAAVPGVVAPGPDGDTFVDVDDGGIFFVELDERWCRDVGRGGLSGGPALLRHDTNGDVRYELVGVISGYSDRWPLFASRRAWIIVTRFPRQLQPLFEASREDAQAMMTHPDSPWQLVRMGDLRSTSRNVTFE